KIEQWYYSSSTFVCTQDADSDPIPRHLSDALRLGHGLRSQCHMTR
uniref:Uncharacterized protein n=1 Tax=Aegilops tauschii subsp. strangulata TaxID=200361 RepID=A0A453C6T1_AEGTS